MAPANTEPLKRLLESLEIQVTRTTSSLYNNIAKNAYNTTLAGQPPELLQIANSFANFIYTCYIDTKVLQKHLNNYKKKNITIQNKTQKK